MPYIFVVKYLSMCNIALNFNTIGCLIKNLLSRKEKHEIFTFRGFTFRKNTERF